MRLTIRVVLIDKESRTVRYVTPNEIHLDGKTLVIEIEK